MDFLNDPDVQYWLSLLVSHVLLAFPLMKMAVRTKDEQAWFAWIPVLNGVLALRVAARPLWWIVLFFIPILNLVMLVLLTMALCERFGVNKWWGLIGFITPLNIILIYYLAYGTKGVQQSKIVKDAQEPGAVPDAAPQEQSRPVGEGAEAAAEPSPARTSPEQGSDKKDEDLSQPNPPESKM